MMMLTLNLHVRVAFYQGELIGVAGITIYIDLLGPLTDAVNVALGNRVTGYSVNLDVNGYVNLTCSVTVSDHLQLLKSVRSTCAVPVCRCLTVYLC